MNHSRNSITKYTTDEKTRGAFNNILFNSFGHINDQFYENAKSGIKHKKPIIVNFFYPAVRYVEVVGAVLQLFFLN